MGRGGGGETVVAVPNIEKAELHPDWIKLFNDTYKIEYAGDWLKFCLTLVYEDNTTADVCGLKYDVIDGIPSALFDIVPRKNVRRIVVIVKTGGYKISLVNLFPPEGENAMDKGKRYTFRMFIRLKGAEWLGTEEQAKKQEAGQEQEQGQE